MSSRRNRSATLRDLEGKTVSVDLPNGGTFVTALTVFERLGMKPKVVYIEQRIALEKLKAGEIDAVIVVGGKPYKSVSSFKDDRFHLVTVDYAKPLQGDYLPARLSAKDYPNLISDGRSRSTPSRCRRCLRPITGRRIPTGIGSSRSSWMPFSPNFRPSRIRRSIRSGRRSRCPRRLPDWQRLPAAQQWLDQPWRRAGCARQVRGIPETEPGGGESCRSDADKEALFKQFQAWEAEQNARRRRRRDEPRPRQKQRVRAIDRAWLSFDAASGSHRIGARQLWRTPVTSALSIPRFNAARAASRCSGVMWARPCRIAVASTAASSVKPSTGSMSGMKSNGRMK